MDFRFRGHDIVGDPAVVPSKAGIHATLTERERMDPDASRECAFERPGHCFAIAGALAGAVPFVASPAVVGRGP